MDNTHRHRKFKMESATTARASAVKYSFIGAAAMFILVVLIIGFTLGVSPETDKDIIPEILNDKFDAQDVKGIALLFALSVSIVGVILMCVGVRNQRPRLCVGVRNQRPRLPERTDSETNLPVATVIEMHMFSSRERSESSTSTASSTSL